MEMATIIQINDVTEVNKSVPSVTETTNQTNEYEYEYFYEYDTDSAVAIITDFMSAAIYGFALISIIVNTFNIFVIVSSRLCKQLSYALIINLSICDALVAFSLPTYFIVLDFKPEWLEVMWLTVIMDYLFTVLSLATLLTVLSMTCELFYMVRYPLKHLRHFKDGQKYKVVIASIWVLATVPAILLDFIIPLFHSERTVSYIEEVTTDIYEPYWFSVVVAILCLFTMIFLYFIIIKDIYKSHKLNQRGSRNMRKSAVTVCLIVFTYFLLYLPYWITVGVWVLDSIVITIYSELFDQFYLMTFLLQIINTACDPMVYAFRIKKIRQSAKKIFCKCTCHTRCHRNCRSFHVTHISNNGGTETTT